MLRMNRLRLRIHLSGLKYDAHRLPTLGVDANRHWRSVVSSSTPKIEHVVHVCTSCRPPGSPREPFYQRTGYKLFQALKTAMVKSDLANVVEIQSTECLSICPRPCGIAISSPGSWSYLFGDQEPSTSVEEIMECLALYVASDKGVMPRNQRPKGMRRSILGRVPPLGDPNASI